MKEENKVPQLLKGTFFFCEQNPGSCVKSFFFMKIKIKHTSFLFYPCRTRSTLGEHQNPFRIFETNFELVLKEVMKQFRNYLKTCFAETGSKFKLVSKYNKIPL